MKSQRHSPSSTHEHNLARKVGWASVVISLCALVAVFLELTSFSLAVECLILVIGILVTGTCLLFVIKEHRPHQMHERVLIQHVVERIKEQKLSSITPHLLTKALEAHLAQLAPAQRLPALNEYLNNPSHLLKLLSDGSFL